MIQGETLKMNLQSKGGDQAEVKPKNREPHQCILLIKNWGVCVAAWLRG